MKPVVLVTGSSRGIGARIARDFAEQGYPVAINYLHSRDNATALLEALRQQERIAFAYQCDVSDAEQVGRMFQSVERDMAPVGILVNNAGIASMRLFSDITQAEWDRTFAVNVRGMFHCIQAALPAMISAKRGRIVNIASVWGMVGASCEVHYSAAKAAVIGLTKALAKEVGPSGVAVNCVAPGATYTDMLAGFSPAELRALEQEIPLGRIADPAEISASVLYLGSTAADFITGQVLSPNGGFVI